MDIEIYQQYYYILGFLAACAFMPVYFLLMKKFNPKYSNTCKNFSIILILTTSTIITPHCSKWQIALVLPMIWLMTLYITIEEETNKRIEQILYMTLIPSSILLINSGIELASIATVTIISTALYMVSKIPNARVDRIKKMFHPIILLIVMPYIKFGNYITFFIYFFQAILAYLILKIFYAYINPNQKIYDRSFILISLLSWSKYYFMAWFAFFVTTNTHVILR